MRGFVESWIEYYSSMVNTADFDKFAKEMDQGKLKLLSPEQIETMEKIKETLK
jgi:hypothetical protein